MTQLGARSASRQVKEWLGEGLSAGRVLAVHRRACNLVADQGRVIALVAPEIGDGPLNVVLRNWPGSLCDVHAGTSVTYEPGWLVLSGVGIDLGAAETWEPCPNWEALRARQATIELCLSTLAALCLDHDPDSALLPLLGASSHVHGRASILLDRLCKGAGKLEAGWSGDEKALIEGGAALAGLGDGLTPAGDDFLVGAMLWAWLAHPAPKQFCSALAEAAAPRTTTLSAAFLRAAARGQCGAAWHGLLAALSKGQPAESAGAARGVLAHGASSGLDALIGFLYLSLHKEDACRTSM